MSRYKKVEKILELRSDMSILIQLELVQGCCGALPPYLGYDMHISQVLLDNEIWRESCTFTENRLLQSVNSKVVSAWGLRFLFDHDLTQEEIEKIYSSFFRTPYPQKEADQYDAVIR